MTVSELIEKLRAMPQDARVFFRDNELETLYTPGLHQADYIGVEPHERIVIIDYEPDADAIPDNVV